MRAMRGGEISPKRMRLLASVALLGGLYILGPGPAFSQTVHQSLYDLYLSSGTPPYYRRALYRVLRRDPTRNIAPPDPVYAQIYGPPPAAPTRQSQPAAAQTSSQPSAFVFHAAYAFPNPSRGGTPVDFRLQVGQADSVDLLVSDMAGHRVVSASLSASSTLDDGNGRGPQLTYDYVWKPGASGASGVYIFAFIAHKAGQPDIHKTGKVAVIK